ncbi:hypothetical protein COBT_002670, partial [Conglomerata obtusa]
MSKIKLSDLLPNAIPERQPIISLHTPPEPQNPTQVDHFFTLSSVEPSILEKAMQKAITKKSHVEKARENVLFARFDSKMRRINKIKSKTYRRMRRKEKVQQEIVDEGDVVPNKMIGKFEKENDVGENNKVKDDCSESCAEDFNFFAASNKFVKNDIEIEDKLKSSNKITDTKYIEDDTTRDKNNLDIYENKSKFIKKLLRRNNNTENQITNIQTFDGKKDSEIQREMVKEIFKDCDDEFEDKFKKEKKEIITDEMPFVEKEILPGWNSWGGTGLEVIETKFNTIIKKREGINFEDRKDFKQSHIIINEKNIGLDEKYKTELPFGYTNDEYKLKMDLPVTKEWNSLRIFNKF